MISLNQIDSIQVLDNHISVKGAASYSGYSSQYIRRLLRTSRLEGVKVGQLWLIEKSTLEFYIQKAQEATDQRFGPK